MNILKDAINRWDRQHEQEFWDDLRSLVAMRDEGAECVNSGESESNRESEKHESDSTTNHENSLDVALRIAEKLGFEVEHVSNTMAIAQIKGKSDKAIAISGRVNVEPVCAGWQTDPYELTLKDGYAIGRGVLGSKGPLLCALYAIAGYVQPLVEVHEQQREANRALPGKNEQGNETAQINIKESNIKNGSANDAGRGEDSKIVLSKENANANESDNAGANSNANESESENEECITREVLPYTFHVIITSSDECRDSDFKEYENKYGAPAFMFAIDGEWPLTYAGGGILQVKMTSNPIENPNILEIHAGGSKNALPDKARALVVMSDECDKSKLTNSDTRSVRLLSAQDADIDNSEKTRLGTNAQLAEVEVDGTCAYVNTVSKREINCIRELCKCISDSDILSDLKLDEVLFYKLIAWLSGTRDGGNINLAYCDEEFGDLSFNVVNIDKENDRLTLLADVRYPQSVTMDSIIERLQQIAKRRNASLDVIKDVRPWASNVRSREARKLMSVFRSKYGSGIEPVITSYDTSARYFPGSVAFGAVERRYQVPEEWNGGIYGANEAEEEYALLDAIEIYRKAIRKLLKLDFSGEDE